jgi:Ca2+/Na+ antiporter
MSTIEELILNLKSAKESHNEIFFTIKDYDMLISALYELKNIIGNEEVKNSIVDQINYFLFMKSKQNQRSNEQVMLNTVLYGPPGVGKTIIGTVLSKIWYSIGYFKEEKIEKLEEKLIGAKTFKDFYDGKMNYDEIINIAIYVISFLLIFSSLISSLFSNKVMLILFLLFLLYLVFLSYYFSRIKENKKNKNHSQRNLEELKTNNYLEDKSLIKIVSRDDFVDRYVGWTGKKTQALLESAKGKVLFVDEAYSLVNDPRDSFGIEALTVINLFLSQHPGSIIVIFAGYRDLLERNIFSVQPGLRRRFMWHFECKPYNTEELFKIFLYQISREDWTVSKKDLKAIKQLISENKELFTENGGDTEKLFYFSKLEYSRDFVRNQKNLVEKTLNYQQIRNAINQLRNNKNQPVKERTENFLDLLKYY